MKKILGLMTCAVWVCLLLAGCTLKLNDVPAEQSSETTGQTTRQEASVPDLLSGKTLTGRDGSTLQLNADGSYIWYQNKAVTDDNYYKGTYEIYVGAEAVTMMSSMSEYGVTEQEQLDLIARNADDGITVNDWYVMVQTRTYRMVGGQETNENTKIVYMGIYYKDQNTYDSANCNSGNYAVFTVS